MPCRFLRFVTPVLLGIFFHPAWARACAVCFGDAHSSQTKGVFAGVAMMLGVTAFVLGNVAITIFVWARRAKTLQQETP